MDKEAKVAAKAQVANLFETPFIVDQFRDAAAANAAFTEIILAKMDASPGVQVSNRGSWHSTTDMIDWGGEHARPLIEHVIALADRFTVDVRGRGTARFAWFPEMWANVTDKGGSNTFHYHSGCVWSAVYYVADGYSADATAAAAEGGELVLLDPRAPAATMTAPDLRYRRPDGQVYGSEMKMKPVSGRIVMFPSYMMHAVNPYLGSGRRISIAINLTAVPLAGKAAPQSEPSEA